jgi:hypothetical protein
MTTNKIPFALMEGKLIDVTQADKKIDYSCPDCSSVLRKRGGDIVTDHFYHFTPSECTGESVIHKAYKQALLECKELCYRDYMGNLKCLQFDRVELEKGFNGGSIIVDAVGYINNIMHFIEFANTHYIDERKRKKIEKSNIFCIEITIPNDIKTFDRIKTFLTHSGYNRKVIHNPLTKNLKAEYDRLNKKYKMINNLLNEKNIKIKTYIKFLNQNALTIQDLNNEINKYIDNISELKFEINLINKHNKRLDLFNHKSYLEFRHKLIDTIRGLKNCEHYSRKIKNDYIKEIIKEIESYLINTRKL